MRLPLKMLWPYFRVCVSFFLSSVVRRWRRWIINARASNGLGKYTFLFEFLGARKESWSWAADSRMSKVDCCQPIANDNEQRARAQTGMHFNYSKWNPSLKMQIKMDIVQHGHEPVWSIDSIIYSFENWNRFDCYRNVRNVGGVPCDFTPPKIKLLLPKSSFALSYILIVVHMELMSSNGMRTRIQLTPLHFLSRFVQFGIRIASANLCKWIRMHEHKWHHSIFGEQTELVPFESKVNHCSCS